MARVLATSLIVFALFEVGCVKVQSPTDTGDPVAATPTAPTSPTAPASNPTTPAPDPTTPAATDPNALAYNPDLKLVFAADCVICHGPTRADANYRMSTYAQVMAAVRPGSSSSVLAAVTQPNGRMYRYFSGSTTTRQSKSNQVLTWIVKYNAQENK
jgi:hypothetical protein